MSDSTASPPAPRELIRILLLLGGLMLNGLVAAPLSPTLPSMARELGQGYDGAFIAQYVLAIPGIMMVVGGLAAQPLVAWFGKRLVMQVGFVLYGLSGLTGLVAPDVPTLLVSRLLLGLASGVVSSVAVSLIADFYEGAARARMIGFSVAIGTLSASVGLLATGLLTDLFGWRTSFLIYAISLPPTLLVGPVVARQARGAGRSAAAALPLADLLPNWHLYALLLVCSIVLFTKTTQGPFLMAALDVTSASVQGAILSAGVLVGAAASAALFLVRRFLEPIPILLLSMGLLGGALLVAGLIHGLAAIAVVNLFIGLFGGFVIPVFKVVALDRTPERSRTLAAGSLTAVIFLGQFLNPVTLKPVVEALGIRGAFAGLGIAAIVAVGLIAAARQVRALAAQRQPVQ